MPSKRVRRLAPFASFRRPRDRSFCASVFLKREGFDAVKGAPQSGRAVVPLAREHVERATKRRNDGSGNAALDGDARGQVLSQPSSGARRGVPASRCREERPKTEGRHKTEGATSFTAAPSIPMNDDSRLVARGSAALRAFCVPCTAFRDPRQTLGFERRKG